MEAVKYTQEIKNDNAKDKFAIYFKRMKEFIPDSYQDRLPAESTCVWALVEESEDYPFRHFFLNLLAGIAMDLCSDAFLLNDLIGGAFFVGTFEH